MCQLLKKIDDVKELVDVAVEFADKVPDEEGVKG